MSVWNSIWSAASTAIPVNVNPQGVTAAPVGTIAVRSCDGAIYVKRGGGSTAFGWYLFGSDQFVNWQPRFVAAAANAIPNASGQGLAGNPSTIINHLPTHSGVATIPSPRRGYVGGYTSGGAGNVFLVRLTTNNDNVPSQRFDSAGLAATFQEFDCWFDVLTTPRSNSGATSTDLTTGTIRILVGGGFGAAALQLSGGTGNTDILSTEWPTMLSGVDGLFGFGFRFNNAVDAGLWQFLSTVRVAGAYGQTVTPLSAIAINTAYRLRVRYVFVSGVLTALASINDGTEVAVTTNVSPVAPFAVGQTQPFQPIVSCRSVTANFKSLVCSQVAMNYGIGVGLTC